MAGERLLLGGELKTTVKQNQPRARDLSVDTARGFACLLLVAYHVIGNEPSNGLRVADGPYRLSADLLAYIRMPLFTFLSGYVYAWRPFQRHCRPFIAGKARRLLIPMVVVGTLFVFIRLWTPGTNQSDVTWYLLHIFPVEHFWFVESLFLVFLLIIPLEFSGILKEPIRFALFFVGVVLVYVSGIEFPHNYFSINGVFYLLPFFLGGLACSRFTLQAGRFYYPLLLLGLVLPYLYILLELRSGEWLLERRGGLALWIGLSASFLLLRSGLTINVLARIGHYSYAIYLFHVFFTAAARIFLLTVGIEQTLLLLLIGTLAGLLGPISLEVIASYHPWSSVLLLGKWRKQRQRPMPILEHETPLWDKAAP